MRQNTSKDAESCFSFDLAPLSGSETDDLKSIALTIFHTTAFIAGSPRMGVSFILRGQLPGPQVGEYWSGRPHVHLVRFREQGKTAVENEARHGEDFGRILCRVSTLDAAAARQSLPKNARMFQDYGAYLSSASSLWVWSLEGLSAQGPRIDANRGNLIYERQVLAELLEYGYMLNRSLYHRVDELSSTAKVIAVRRDILRLQHNMREASHSGEIRDLLENGWNELGLPSLVSEIETGLRIRESETRSAESLRSERIARALTVVFGLVAVPALAEQVIGPLWKLTSLPQLNDAPLATVIADGISILVVLLVLWAALSMISPPEI